MFGMRMGRLGSAGGARLLPSLDLDFVRQVYQVNGVGVALGSIMATTRASTGTYFDSAGALQTAANNVPRIDYDPSTLACRGLLVEAQRTNELLNSLANGANLGTQNVTVTAAQRTLSFFGTGTVTLSGAATASVVGTGAYPNRRTYTFTPSAGTLTITVSGTVQFAQQELGPAATSFIPTAGAAAQRNADDCIVTLGAWFSKLRTSMLAEFDFQESSGALSYPAVAGLVDSVGSVVQSNVLWLATGTLRAWVGTTNVSTGKEVNAGTTNKALLSVDPSNYVATSNGLSPATGAAASSLATMAYLRLGSYASNPGYLNGHVRRVRIWPSRDSAAQAQARTS